MISDVLTSSARESLSPAILELCEATRVLKVRLHPYKARQEEQGHAASCVECPQTLQHELHVGMIRCSLPSVDQLLSVLC